MENYRSLKCLILIFVLFYQKFQCQVIYRNPLPSLDSSSYQDPWVILVNDRYYYCGSEDDKRLFIKSSINLPDILNAPKFYIYTPPENTNYSKELWAPELHYLYGHWYVYFAADDGFNANHKMYALEGGSDPNDPLNGSYTLKAELKPTTVRWAIDGTPFIYGNTLYFVWSGWPGFTDVEQCIYISEMSNPYTIKGDRVEISCATEPWETNHKPYVNEGPQILIHNNIISIVYSASGSWTDDYCLGILTAYAGSNLLIKSSWTKIGPVFKKQDKVFGTGHPSFVKSKNGLVDLMVYHAAKYEGSGWNRNVRIQKFTFHENIPYFGPPIQPVVKISLESNNLAPEGTFKIKSFYSGLYISVGKCTGGETEPIIMAHQQTDLKLVWTLKRNKDGYYKITSACSNLNMDNAAALLNAGNRIIQYRENGNDAQLWHVEKIADNLYKISNKRSLLYLDSPNDINIPLIQWYSTNDESQLFQLEGIL